MEFVNEDLTSRFEANKHKIQENISMGKSMGINKISAILAIDDEGENIQSQLVNWLLIEGYKISLKKDDYSILTIEW